MFQYKEVPKFNEVGFIATNPYSSTQPISYAEIIKLIRKTPEAIGILRAIQNDICSDGYTFIGPKYKVETAKLFTKKNRFKDEFRSCIFDWELLGNGALWKAKISESTVKETIRKLEVVSGIQVKETEMKMYVDEDVYCTKLIKHAPWSTMQIDLTPDKTSISQFRQMVNGEPTDTFAPEEIIHGKFMDFDGKVYGFSPIEASINVISTLALIKDLNGTFFQNGGVPDWMFILPKEMAGSPNVLKLEQALQKYKNSRHKHGNLVFTGEVQTVQMNKFDKDMEFRQLAIYYTGILALAFNMPMSRVASIIGSEVNSGAADSDLSEAGYWRMISTAQDYWEDLLNTQLFEPEFGVEIVFNRGYKNDEIKEAQRDVQALQVAVPLVKSGFVSADYLKERLHIPDRYWNENGDIELLQVGNSFGGAGGSPGSVPDNDMKGDAQQANAERKKKQATQASARR